MARAVANLLTGQDGRKRHAEMSVMLFQGNAIFKEMKHYLGVVDVIQAFEVGKTVLIRKKWKD
jgi:hypothetical protein